MRGEGWGSSLGVSCLRHRVYYGRGRLVVMIDTVRRPRGLALDVDEAAQMSGRLRRIPPAVSSASGNQLNWSLAGEARRGDTAP